jgi:hypothetical protein
MREQHEIRREEFAGLGKRLGFWVKNAVLEYKTEGCRPPLKRGNYPGDKLFGPKVPIFAAKKHLETKISCSFVSFRALSENKKCANFRFVR